ncbi:hypothetical protein [Acetobacter papayae]|uniref:hypothetical protein n=1 Tax=Acetobacter papayae TaxID=1076592 RepID=UPI001F2EF01D|nr:hypothetical protein [Acetobacter papayae]
MVGFLAALTLAGACGARALSARWAGGAAQLVIIQVPQPDQPARQGQSDGTKPLMPCWPHWSAYLRAAPCTGFPRRTGHSAPAVVGQRPEQRTGPRRQRGHAPARRPAC